MSVKSVLKMRALISSDIPKPLVATSNQRAAALLNFLEQFRLAFVSCVAERGFAAHFGAFLLDKERKVQNTHAFTAEPFWHDGLAPFRRARLRHRLTPRNLFSL